jgi:succinate dehydrogenase / fumarate reductase membrane anchor subunit
MSFRTPLGQVRGLGSARSGTAHWWAQRLTALALIPLSLWFVVSVAHLIYADYSVAIDWLHTPWVAVLLTLMLAALFYHAYLGVQVVVEDYVHNEWLKVSTLLLFKSATVLLAMAGIFSILRIAFGA